MISFNARESPTLDEATFALITCDETYILVVRSGVLTDDQLEELDRVLTRAAYAGCAQYTEALSITA